MKRITIVAADVYGKTACLNAEIDAQFVPTKLGYNTKNFKIWELMDLTISYDDGGSFRYVPMIHPDNWSRWERFKHLIKRKEI